MLLWEKVKKMDILAIRVWEIVIIVERCWIFLQNKLNKLKNRKAEGKYGIPAELLKALGVKGKRELYDISNEIYVTGEWPDDFLDSVIIPIDKKRGAQDCIDFRTISLVSHPSKIVLKILTRRLESTAESYLGKDQFHFRKGRDTRDAIAALKMEYRFQINFLYLQSTPMFCHIVISLVQSTRSKAFS